jgi:hypothetical protein
MLLLKRYNSFTCSGVTLQLISDRLMNTDTINNQKLIKIHNTDIQNNVKYEKKKIVGNGCNLGSSFWGSAKALHIVRPMKWIDFTGSNIMI